MSNISDNAKFQAIEIVKKALENNALTLLGPKGWQAGHEESGRRDGRYLTELIKEVAQGIDSL